MAPLISLHRPAQLDRWLVRAPLALMLACALGGCRSEGASDGTMTATTLPRACEVFVASYGQLLAESSSASDRVARARMDQTRASLELQLRRSDAAALDAQCKAALTTLPTRGVAATETHAPAPSMF